MESEEVLKHTEEAKDYIDIVDKLTLPQTKPLDNLIAEISSLLQTPNELLEMDRLQPYYLKLATELYLMVDKLKQFEIYSSLAKANNIDNYNNKYLEEAVAYEKKPSATELQIRAELKTKKESVVNTIYASAFKTIKSKIDAGNMVADTLKHIIKTKYNVEYASNQLDNMNTIRG